MKTYFTVPEAAKICSVNRSTMHRWVTSGKIKSYSTPGGSKRIQKEDLKICFEQNKIPIEFDDFETVKKKILIVDDDIHIQNNLKRMLAGPLTELEFASDGFQVGTKLLSFKPNLIILDLFMPNMDGFEVCKYIKNDPSNNTIKILIISGYDTTENRDKAIGLGADSFLGKPFQMKEIMDQVERLIT